MNDQHGPGDPAGYTATRTGAGSDLISEGGRFAINDKGQAYTADIYKSLGDLQKAVNSGNREMKANAAFA